MGRVLAAGGSGGGGGGEGGGPNLILGSGQTQQVTKKSRKFKIFLGACLLGNVSILLKSKVNFWLFPLFAEFFGDAEKKPNFANDVGEASFFFWYYFTIPALPNKFFH